VNYPFKKTISLAAGSDWAMQ